MDNELATTIHHAKREQVDALEHLFAQPVQKEEGGELEWVTPEWFKLIQRTCRS